MRNPLIQYHFYIEWGGTRIGVSEISGLNVELDVVERRDSASPEFSKTKMPVAIRYSDIVLTRRIHKGDNEFYNWINQYQLNTIERRDLTISLLNESHDPTVVWRVKNAFPRKYIGPVLNANQPGPAMESLILAHEGLRVENV